MLDRYGPLLTEKQRDIYEWYYQQDLSLGEIGEVVNVSRNAVFDLISRTDIKLERFEKALGLVAAEEKRVMAQDALAASFEAWLASHQDCLGNEAREALAGLIRRIREQVQDNGV